MRHVHLGVLLGQRLDFTCIIVQLAELVLNLSYVLHWGAQFPLWMNVLFVILHMIVIRLAIVGCLYNFSRKTMPKMSRHSWLHEALVVCQEFIYGVCSLYAFCFPFASVLTKEFEVGRNSINHQSRNSPVKYPILFVHGYACNSGYWYPLLRFLSNSGVTQMYTITMTPLHLDVRSFTVQLAEKVERVLKETKSEKLILVGHSMGGLVARAFIKWNGGETNVAKLVTLQTPHKGTKIGRCFLAKLFYGDCVDDMLPGSEFLRDLGAIEESNGSGKIPVVSVFSHHDLIITPQSSSYIEGPNVKNYSFFGIGHLTMPFTKHIQNLILRELENAI
eukprot:g1424.t1